MWENLDRLGKRSIALRARKPAVADTHNPTDVRFQEKLRYRQDGHGAGEDGQAEFGNVDRSIFHTFLQIYLITRYENASFRNNHPFASEDRPLLLSFRRRAETRGLARIMLRGSIRREKSLGLPSVDTCFRQLKVCRSASNDSQPDDDPVSTRLINSRTSGNIVAQIT